MKTNKLMTKAEIAKVMTEAAEEVSAPVNRHKILVAYLLAKVDEGDWHGVSDAANDLRVLEAQHPELW